MHLFLALVFMLGINRKDSYERISFHFDILASIQGVVIHDLYLPSLISSNEDRDVNIDCRYSIDETETDTQVKT